VVARESLGLPEREIEDLVIDVNRDCDILEAIQEALSAPVKPRVRHSENEMDAKKHVVMICEVPVRAVTPNIRVGCPLEVLPEKTKTALANDPRIGGMENYYIRNGQVTFYISKTLLCFNEHPEVAVGYPRPFAVQLPSGVASKWIEIALSEPEQERTKILEKGTLQSAEGGGGGMGSAPETVSLNNTTAAAVNVQTHGIRSLPPSQGLHATSLWEKAHMWAPVTMVSLAVKTEKGTVIADLKVDALLTPYMEAFLKLHQDVRNCEIEVKIMNTANAGMSSSVLVGVCRNTLASPTEMDLDDNARVVIDTNEKASETITLSPATNAGSTSRGVVWAFPAAPAELAKHYPKLVFIAFETAQTTFDNQELQAQFHIYSRFKRGVELIAYGPVPSIGGGTIIEGGVTPMAAIAGSKTARIVVDGKVGHSSVRKSGPKDVVATVMAELNARIDGPLPEPPSELLDGGKTNYVGVPLIVTHRGRPGKKPWVTSNIFQGGTQTVIPTEASLVSAGMFVDVIEYLPGTGTIPHDMELQVKPSTGTNGYVDLGSRKVVREELAEEPAEHYLAAQAETTVRNVRWTGKTTIGNHAPVTGCIPQSYYAIVADGQTENEKETQAGQLENAAAGVGALHLGIANRYAGRMMSGLSTRAALAEDALLPATDTEVKTVEEERTLTDVTVTATGEIVTLTIPAVTEIETGFGMSLAMSKRTQFDGPDASLAGTATFYFGIDRTEIAKEIYGVTCAPARNVEDPIELPSGCKVLVLREGFVPSVAPETAGAATLLHEQETFADRLALHYDPSAVWMLRVRDVEFKQSVMQILYHGPRKQAFVKWVNGTTPDYATNKFSAGELEIWGAEQVHDENTLPAGPYVAGVWNDRTANTYVVRPKARQLAPKGLPVERGVHQAGAITGGITMSFMSSLMNALQGGANRDLMRELAANEDTLRRWITSEEGRRQYKLLLAENEARAARQGAQFRAQENFAQSQADRELVSGGLGTASARAQIARQLNRGVDNPTPVEGPTPRGEPTERQPSPELAERHPLGGLLNPLVLDTESTGEPKAAPRAPVSAPRAPILRSGPLPVMELPGAVTDESDDAPAPISVPNPPPQGEDEFYQQVERAPRAAIAPPSSYIPEDALLGVRDNRRVLPAHDVFPSKAAFEQSGMTEGQAAAQAAGNPAKILAEGEAAALKAHEQLAAIPLIRSQPSITTGMLHQKRPTVNDTIHDDVARPRLAFFGAADHRGVATASRESQGRDAMRMRFVSGGTIAGTKQPDYPQKGTRTMDSHRRGNWYQNRSRGPVKRVFFD